MRGGSGSGLCVEWRKLSSVESGRAEIDKGYRFFKHLVIVRSRERVTLVSCVGVVVEGRCWIQGEVDPCLSCVDVVGRGRGRYSVGEKVKWLRCEEGEGQVSGRDGGGFGLRGESGEAESRLAVLGSREWLSSIGKQKAR